jgi:hypothetical protein
MRPTVANVGGASAMPQLHRGMTTPMRAIARFTRFTQLPQELQDSIWCAAISGYSLRTAYLVDLRFRHWDQATGNNGPQIELHSVGSAGINDNFSTLSAMLVTCRQSSIFATQAWCSHIAANTCPFNIGGLHRAINAHHDVVILHGNWYFRMHFYSATIAQSQPDPLKPLRYVGVQLVSSSWSHFLQILATSLVPGAGSWPRSRSSACTKRQ